MHAARLVEGISSKTAARGDETEAAVSKYMDDVILDLTGDGEAGVAEVTSELMKGEAPKFHIVTKFLSRRGSQPLVVTIRPKQGVNYDVIVPKRLTHNQKRGTIHFSRVQPFGINVDFAEYVRDSLQEVVNKKWTTEAAAREWYKDSRKKWVTDTASKYRAFANKRKTSTRAQQARSAQAAAATKRKLFEEAIVDMVQKKKKQTIFCDSPLVFNHSAKKKASSTREMLEVPLPDFAEMRGWKSRVGEVQAIRLHARDNKVNRNKPACYLYIPRLLIGEDARRGKQYSLGTAHGTNHAWMRFVYEYVVYAVGHLKTFEKMKRWCGNIREFITHVQELYEFTGGNRNPADKVWCIRPSKLPVDQEYVDKGYFPKDAPLGMGLYCTRPGSHTLVFDGPKLLCITTDKKPSKIQGYYMALYDQSEGTRVMPTAASFRTWVVPHTFIVGHLRQPYGNPTHRADFVGEFAVLTPLRPAKKGEEFSFDYGYLKPSVKDVDVEASPN